MTLPPPEQALKMVVAMLQRAPMNELEAVGINQCIASLEQAAKELKEFKNPPPVRPAD